MYMISRPQIISLYDNLIVFCDSSLCLTELEHHKSFVQVCVDICTELIASSKFFPALVMFKFPLNKTKIWRGCAWIKKMPYIPLLGTLNNHQLQCHEHVLCFYYHQLAAPHKPFNVSFKIHDLARKTLQWIEVGGWLKDWSPSEMLCVQRCLPTSGTLLLWECLPRQRRKIIFLWHDNDLRNYSYCSESICLWAPACREFLLWVQFFSS